MPSTIKDKELFEMNTEEKRLQSYKNWPFGMETSINKEKMAAAGFFFIGSKKEPDLVRCFVCLKELDGWETEDDPWQEHKSHAPYCQFIQLNKPENQLTYKDMHQLEMYRQINMATKVLQKKIQEFEKQAENTRGVIEGLA